jgi:hypothetical protein
MMKGVSKPLKWILFLALALVLMGTLCFTILFLGSSEPIVTEIHEVPGEMEIKVLPDNGQSGIGRVEVKWQSP